MWFRKILQTSKGREISDQENDMYIRAGAVQCYGGTLCPALAEIIGHKPPVPCDERIYQGLERKDKEISERKNHWTYIFIITAIFMSVYSILGFFSGIKEDLSLSTSYLRIMGIAAVILISGIMYKKKAGAKQSDIRRHIEQREGVTAFSFYINELCWHNSGPDTNTDDAYLVSENILFSVPCEIFNNACRGDYFTGVVVDTGTEKLLYIVNYR